MKHLKFSELRTANSTPAITVESSRKHLKFSELRTADCCVRTPWGNINKKRRIDDSPARIIQNSWENINKKQRIIDDSPARIIQNSWENINKK